MDNQPNNNLDNVPQTWPGAFRAYRYSRAAVVFNWKTYLAIILLTLAVSIVAEILMPASSRSAAQVTVTDSTRGAVVNLATMLISVLLSVSLVSVILANIKRSQVRLGSVLKRSFNYFVNALLMSILQALIILVSLLLFVIPFFFVMPRLTLALYFLVDKDLGPIEALKASWVGTKGHSLKVWGVIGVGILMALLAVTIIGIPFALYFLFMYSAAYGVLYLYINQKSAQLD